MSLFLAALIFCGSVLEFSSQKKIKGLWLSLIEEMRLVEDRSSEFIDTEPRAIKRAKHDPSFSAKNNSSAKTLHARSLKNASEYVERIATKKEKKLNISSSFEVGEDSHLRNDVAKFKATDNSGERTTRNSQNINRIIPSESSGEVGNRRELQRNKSNLNEFFNRSETYHSDGEKLDFDRRTENSRENEKRHEYRSGRHFPDVPQHEAGTIFARNITPPSNSTLQFNGEISGKNSRSPTNITASSKDLVNHLSLQTTAKLSLDNRSSVKSSSTESINASFPVHPHSAPSSRLSKTVVAAIVAVINGIIGFTGAAIFTCKKNNHLRSEEQRPLISRLFILISRSEWEEGSFRA